MPRRRQWVRPRAPFTSILGTGALAQAGTPGEHALREARYLGFEFRDLVGARFEPKCHRLL